ncbi:hypothetical protein [Hyphococcus sp. DH-69]|uniref:RipA family octameric membrane protein n=1 Tax=Hyphococcus formosus TaxID=3143534 RepID=UPI00398B0C98
MEKNGVFHQLNRILKIFWDNTVPGLEEIEEAEYEQLLIHLESDSQKLQKKAKRAFEAAYDLRKFEIEMYWKRANYFWTFIAAVFTGYAFMIREGSGATFEPFALACVGIVLSYAWWTTNRGSKAWQRHWEKHLDKLEDQFMGPLYKTVAMDRTYSVSKSNEIVSFSFVVFWGGVALQYLNSRSLLHPFDWSGPKFEYIFPLIVTALAICALENGYGRGRFGNRHFKMYKRAPKYVTSKKANGVRVVKS